MAISAKDVNKLRQMTGAGMMDCKKALVEADGDFDKAIEFLRKKGQKVTNARADRETTEGVVFSKVSADGNKGILVSFSCETDFVAKNEQFKKLVSRLTSSCFEVGKRGNKLKVSYSLTPFSCFLRVESYLNASSCTTTTVVKFLRHAGALGCRICTEIGN